MNDEVHEFDGEPSALSQYLFADHFDVGKGGKEKQHRKAVVQVGDGILQRDEEDTLFRSF